MAKIIKNIILFIYRTIQNESTEKLYYDDIFECPIRNYQRCFEENDSRYLLKKYNNKHPDNLYDVIKSMSDKLIDDFGLSPIVEIRYFKERDLLKAELSFLSTGNTSFLNDIQFLESDIKRIDGQMDREQSGNIKETNSRNHRILTQFLGYESKKLSVYDFHVASKDCSEANKKADSSNVRDRMRKVS